MFKIKYVVIGAAMSFWTLSACQPNENQTGTSAEETGTNAVQRLEQSDEAASFTTFTLEDGDCKGDEVFVLNPGGGDDVEMNVVSLIALNKVTITSKQGDDVPLNDGYTLYIANYQIDPEHPGENPNESQIKIEMTLISQDGSPTTTGVYGRTSAGNLAAGPNLFYNGRTFPMKNNFIGGVKITSVDNGYLCGEIRLKSKFDVVIKGRFKAPLQEVPENGMW